MKSEKPKEILLVDDDADYRELTRMRLESSGYRVSSVGDGREAVELLKKDYRPALILLDVNMPEKNGLATVINIENYFNRSDVEGKRIPIIIATGLQSEKIQEIFVSKKVDDYIRKPYKPEELLEKVRRLID